MVGGIDMLDSDAGFSHAEDAPPRSFLRHRRFIPYPPAGRPGGKMPPPGGDSLCNRRARRLLGG